MKKVLLLLIPALLIGFAGCKKEKEKEEEPKKDVAIQNAVVYYFGGTWCPPCGANGKPATQNAKKISDKAIVISSQVNGAGGQQDPFNNSFANQLSGVFRPNGVPSIFVGCPDSLTAIGSNTAMSSNTETRVRSAITKKPVVYGKPKVKLDGNNITVDIEAEFFADYNDEYRFAVYVTESGLTHAQASDARTEGKNTHDDVLRLCITSSVIGDVVAPSVKNGDIVSKTYTGTLQDGWKKENLKVVVVYWRKVGSNVTYVNGESVKIQ